MKIGKIVLLIIILSLNINPKKVYGEEIKYYSIIMEVVDEDFLAERTVYFVKNNSTSVDGMESDYQATFLAKQDALYDLINELV